MPPAPSGPPATSLPAVVPAVPTVPAVVPAATTPPVTAERASGPVRALTALLGSGGGPLLARLALVTAAAVAVARFYAAHDTGILCPFRLLTGLPCPTCGSTTAFIELGDGDPVGALAAQPLTVLVFAVVVVFGARVARVWRRLSPSPRVAVLSGVALIAASWVYQVVRLGGG